VNTFKTALKLDFTKTDSDRYLQKLEIEIENAKLLKKDSRSLARANRRYAIYRAKGCCEICDLFCQHIAHVHHVKSVSELGSGDASNLVVLCPNCHAALHVLHAAIKAEQRFQKRGVNRYRVVPRVNRVQSVNSLNRSMYQDDQDKYSLLISICVGHAERNENGTLKKERG